MTLIDRFNNVSRWVATEIVLAPNHRQRISIMRRFIRLAEEFLALNNFNSLLEVLAGLNLAPVQRLKRTWRVRAPAKPPPHSCVSGGLTRAPVCAGSAECGTRELPAHGAADGPSAQLPSLPHGAQELRSAGAAVLWCIFTRHYFYSRRKPGGDRRRDDQHRYLEPGIARHHGHSGARVLALAIAPDIPLARSFVARSHLRTLPPQYHQSVAYGYEKVPWMHNFLSNLVVLTDDALHHHSLLCEPRGNEL